jgi:hypothetical protein
MHRCPRKESGVRAAGVELLLATAIHIVMLVSTVAVLAFAAIKLVLTPATLRKEDIVTISAVENVLTLVYAGQGVASVAPLEHIVAFNASAVALVDGFKRVASGAPVQNIVAFPADQLVVAVRPTVELVVA